MKKILLFFVVTFFIVLPGNSQNFFQLSLKKIDGDTVLLSSYAGKKTMFFILPLSQSDSNFSQLQVFKNRYFDTVRIVGVLSFEHGYQTTNASAMQSLYSSMGITLTEGMYSKKTSGANQSSIMKWLTDKTKNLHFDMDVNGIGHKFFVNESGRLFAVMPPQTSLGMPVIDRIVHSSAQ